MHKMIRCSEKIIARRYNRILLLLNIPSAAAAAILVVISQVIIRHMHVAAELYRFFFLALYIIAAYSFVCTFLVSFTATRKINGHKKYTYIEILGEQMIVSEYTASAYAYGNTCDYRRLWVINLADVEQVTCTGSRMIIKSKARKIEQRADWLEYKADEFGRADFDYWWYNSGGGDIIQSVEIRDDYTYSERIAQRIIFCSEKQKQREIRRAEFRRRMLEAAGRKSEYRKKKPKERVFRGYEIKRNF